MADGDDEGVAVPAGEKWTSDAVIILRASDSVASIFIIRDMFLRLNG